MYTQKHSEEALLTVSPAFAELTEEEANIDGGGWLMVKSSAVSVPQLTELIATAGKAGTDLLNGIAYSFQSFAQMLDSMKGLYK